MPNPTKGESKKDYIARYMSSEEAKSKFPDQKQRLAVAYSKWDNKGKKMKKSIRLVFKVPFNKT